MKDKTFFFGYYEGQRIEVGTPYRAFVPTPDQISRGPGPHRGRRPLHHEGRGEPAELLPDEPRRRARAQHAPPGHLEQLLPEARPPAERQQPDQPARHVRAQPPVRLRLLHRPRRSEPAGHVQLGDRPAGLAGGRAPGPPPWPRTRSWRPGSATTASPRSSASTTTSTPRAWASTPAPSIPSTSASPTWTTSRASATSAGSAATPSPPRPNANLDVSSSLTWIKDKHTVKFGGNFQRATTYSVRNRARTTLEFTGGHRRPRGLDRGHAARPRRLRGPVVREHRAATCARARSASS